MLEPHERVLILEVLRPPLGYELDYAIGTTYSLDLLALLSVPLSFSRFDWESNDGNLVREPYALLEALRRHCAQLTLFCQGGAIYEPASINPLLCHIEESVVQVAAPLGGIFHPKVWVLRFEGENAEIMYRVACLSRNVTFDNSWDISVVFEGGLKDRQNAIAANRPLSEFVATLPSLAAKRSIGKSRKDRIAEIADELLRVSFDLPEGFESYRIWPLGFGNHVKSPLEAGLERLLIVSPFVDAKFIADLHARAVPLVLVSSTATLDSLNRAVLRKGKEIYVLSDTAQPEVEDVDEGASHANNRLEGLHAKMYIAEKGWNAHIVTGSANATKAAFGKNVEVLVELVGKKSKWGIDSFMERGDKGRTTFADMLSKYEPSGPVVKPDEDLKHLELAMEEAIRQLARETLVAKVSQRDNCEEWALEIRTDSALGVSFPTEIVRVLCWPIGIKESLAVEMQTKAALLASFDRVSTNALTTFFAFRFFGEWRRAALDLTRVISIPLEGAPVDRRERILRSMLQDKEQFVKFLFFILSDGTEGAVSGRDGSLPVEGARTGWNWNGNDSLFESMVHALHSNPRRLDEIARVVDDLAKTSDGLSVLPQGFREIWEPICQAREEMRR